jgi:mRNA interferase YafQ
VRAIHETSQFRKDIKRLKKRGKDLAKLKEIVLRIVEGQPLEPKHRDHPLTGHWSGSRDCHIEPDWLLLYRADDNMLYLERSGTHSDLFGS